MEQRNAGTHSISTNKAIQHKLFFDSKFSIIGFTSSNELKVTTGINEFFSKTARILFCIIIVF